MTTQSKEGTSRPELKRVLITGGAGYVGSVLTPRLLELGHEVKVLDLYMYGRDALAPARRYPGLEEIEGDLRDQALLKKILPGCDAVIHLACISNDPSFELNPGLGKSINFDAFEPLVDIARDSGVRRFVYASTSSVYGIKKEANVHEDLPLEPLTDYSKYKALCEEVLLKKRQKGFETLILRPATVCGWGPRLRLDLTVNILTNHAVNNGVIKVFGGEQMRPNIHIEDVADLYVQSLRWPARLIDGKTFNAGYHNRKVREIADSVREIVGEKVKIETVPTDDNRSYHISSEKIGRELGFVARRTIEDAVTDLVAAFKAGKIPDPMTDDRYYNIKMMQKIKLR
jgi:nucleoside-diphosphate-sugar epimerase